MEEHSGEHQHEYEAMNTRDLAWMSDSELERFLNAHDLVACGAGDCLHARCIWCGSEAEKTLSEIQNWEDQDEE